MLSLLLLSALVTAAPDVTVQTLDGQKFTGELIEFKPAAVVVKTDQGPQTLEFEKLMNLTPSEPVATPKAPATLSVRLRDGSQFAATSYQVSRGTAEITLAGGASIKVPSRAIHWVRFQDPSERDDKLAEQWSKIVDAKPAADLLVVRKQGDIDYLEGVIQDIDADTIKFELDKEVVPVKRPKAEGLVYYAAAAGELPEPLCEAADIHGSRVAVKRIALAEGKLQIATPGGLELAWPLEVAATIDFSGGKVQYLSDLDPALVKYVPFFGLKTDVPALAEFFKPTKDAGLEQNPLKLDGKQYRKGLAIHSQTHLEYRLPAKYRRFKTLVGIDDSVREGGHARVEIKGDAKSLWQGVVQGSKPAQSLDLDVEGVKRLEILVDFGNDLDIADHVDLVEARVVK